ncbi:hypothetical protein ES708_26489 [subsurface metagenome]
MRSVIDHFLDPVLALLEAFRVLKKGGQLIIGTFVLGGKNGKNRDTFKENIKNILQLFSPKILYKYILTDHHTWHPKLDELIQLINKCGFNIEKIYWQKGYNEKVCYVKSIKM